MKTPEVYSMYFQAMKESIVQGGFTPANYVGKNDFFGLKTLLEATDSVFVFILTSQQIPDWKMMTEKYGFDQYIDFWNPYLVSNGNYPDQPRKLQLFTLKGKGNGNQTRL